MGQRERDPCAKFPIREAEENTRNAGPWRVGGEESSHGEGEGSRKEKSLLSLLWQTCFLTCSQVKLGRRA
jgi:hypothetical protein